MPWEKVNWGKIEILSGSQITVTGEAKEDIRTQIAHFSVSVTASDDDKQSAINQVNQTMTDILEKVKNFGLEEKDIQTQNISTSKTPPPPDQKAWRASNSISLTLRDVDQASSLADLLNQTDATNINGPRFSLDNTTSSKAKLLEAAVNDAREKAEIVADASGRKLGKVLTVSEGGSQPPIYRSLEMAVSSDESVPTPVEPGSQTVYATATVTFELK